MPVNLINTFDTNFYRDSNPDLRSLSDTQALSHFHNHGLNESRAFSPFINFNFYRSSNPDLAQAGLNSNSQLFEHLQNYGVNEGRQLSPLVDLNFYRASNADLANFNNHQAFDHLQNYGIAEGRRFSPFVDLNLYRIANPDLNAARLNNRQLLEHLARYGVTEGRRFSVAFDSNYYRTANSDLASAGLNNTQLLEHFQRYGVGEGRASSESFNVSYYLSNNSDLRAASFNNQQAYQHFELYGLREGRLGATSRQSVSTDPGNSLNAAFSLDILNGSRTISEFVGSADRDDYYRFTLTSASNFSLFLNGLSDYARAEFIFDSNGNDQSDYSEYLYSTSGSSSRSGAINGTLGAGTYFIRVYTDYTSYNTNYTLGVSATAIPTTTPREPGNTLNAALDIGTVSSNRSVREFVGSADRDDYYRFSLANTSNFNLSVGGLNDSAEVELIFDSNSNGQVDYYETLEEDYGYTNDSASINKILGAGVYFIRVYTDYTSYNTNYTLGVSAIAVPPTTPRDPGNTLGAALDIGTLSGSRSFSDFVGSVDRDDYYRFTLVNTSNFNLSLNSLSDYASVELIFDSNSNGLVDYYDALEEDYGSSNNNLFISSPLGTGTYFIRVSTNYDDSSNTNYSLSLSA